LSISSPFSLIYYRPCPLEANETVADANATEPTQNSRLQIDGKPKLPEGKLRDRE
jgi:hypothetical protein